MVMGEAPQLLPPAARSAPKLSGRFKNNAKTEVKLGSNPPYRAFQLDKFKRIVSQVMFPQKQSPFGLWLP